jgi:uncharacterized protein involved in exopolysaccharide biosynthesis
MAERIYASDDTVDVADVVRTLRRQWRAVLSFVALGVVAALLVVLFAPRRFEGTATLLAKGANAGGTSIGGRITGIGDLLGGLGSMTGASALETELQVLKSRALASEVIDSLQLQFRVREPAGMAPAKLVQSAAINASFKPRTLTFEQAGAGTYRATWNDSVVTFVPSTPTRLDIGSITLETESLPPRFVLTILDREDAISRFSRRLAVSKLGGEIAKITYRGDDSVSAAQAANAVVSFYLRRRKTIDRGVNERRVEYVNAQLDSTQAKLGETERSLRKHQEASGVVDPVAVSEVELESAALLRGQLTDLQVDEATMARLLEQARDGRITTRDLAAYPGFLRGTAIAPQISQLSELEARRIRLLEDRTEKDPDVVAIDKTMRSVEASILATARSYASAISQQRAEVQRRLDRIQEWIMSIPAAAERGGRLKRDVERLTAILTALQAQLVEARLATIGEGGEVRQVDVAVPARDPSFPKPFLTLGLGTAGGLFCGIIAALFLGWFGRWLRDPVEIERAVGVSAQRFEPHAPLLLTSAATARTLLVVPLDLRADVASVVERLAHTAEQRAVNAGVLDLSSQLAAAGNGKGNGGTLEALATIHRMEQENGTVIVRLPPLSSDMTVAALRESRPVLFVAPPGPVDRMQLASAVETLRRLQVPCVGVMLSETRPPRPRALT